MNEERMKQAFIRALEIDESQLTDKLRYNSIVEWDSISHTILVSSLETEFNVSFDNKDVYELESLSTAKTILERKGISFE